MIQFRLCFRRSQAPLGNASREAPLRIGLCFRLLIHSPQLDSPSGAWQDAFPSGAWERQGFFPLNPGVRHFFDSESHVKARTQGVRFVPPQFAP